MLTFSELKSKCEQIMTGPPPDGNEESVTVLCQNDWVRILTVRDPDTSDMWRIEVEVSLPSHIDPKSDKDVRNFIQHLTKHLEYLLRLDAEGLTLGVMSRDGLWTAHLEVENLPSDGLFKTLVPPSV
jgi:hypothetical protein